MLNVSETAEINKESFILTQKKEQKMRETVTAGSLTRTYKDDCINDNKMNAPLSL